MADQKLPEGHVRMIIEASTSGKYGFTAKGDRLGRFAMISVLSMVQRELIDEVYAGVRKEIQPTAKHDKTAQNSAKIDVQPDTDYTDGVSMPKHEAMRTYYEHMEKMRSRILAINQAPDDETFIVPQELLRQL